VNDPPDVRRPRRAEQAAAVLDRVLKRRPAVGEPDPVGVEQHVSPGESANQGRVIRELQPFLSDPTGQRMAGGRSLAGERHHLVAPLQQPLRDHAAGIRERAGHDSQ